MRWVGQPNRVRLSCNQRRVKRVLVLANHGDLAVQGKLHPEIRRAKGHNLVVRARLLRLEVVRRKTRHHKPLPMEPLVEPFQPFILRRQPALRCNIHHQHNLARVLAKRRVFAVNLLHRNVVDRSRHDLLLL